MKDRDLIIAVGLISLAASVVTIISFFQAQKPTLPSTPAGAGDTEFDQSVTQSASGREIVLGGRV